jgi:hypothetical protein
MRSILHSPFGHMRRNVVAYLALFVALGGTSAYAANEWTGANIVDESLTGADMLNGSVASRDVTNGSLTGADVLDNAIGSADVTNGSLTGADVFDQTIGGIDVANSSLTGSDIANASLGGDDLVNGAVTSPKVANDSLSGADIDESTLSMPPTTTATFAGPAGSVPLNGTTFTKVAAKTLPAGSYAIAATVNMHSHFPFMNDVVQETVCDLRNGGGFIGGATDRRVVKEDDNIKVSLSMNGGAQVPAGGGEVSMWCLARGVSGDADYGQMMIIRLDGFS